MPKYVYQGLETGATFELEQRISDAALKTHPETGEPVKRLIGRPAITFKGSGFYANDSKSNDSKSSESKSAKPESSSDTGSSDSKSEPAKTETKPETSSAPTTESKPAPAATAAKD